MKKYFYAASVIVVFMLMYACTHKTQIPQTIVTPGDTTKKTTTTTTTTTDSSADTTKDVVDTSVCFARDILPIFTGYCAMAGCHNAISARDGYILTSYSTIVAKGLVVGSAASSKLYTECTSGKMPESPVAKLDSTQLSLIARWINQGAVYDTNCIVNCDTTKFTYATAIVPIINTYCISCHASAAAAASGGGVALDSYNGLYAQATSGTLLADVQHASGSHYMPLGGAQLSPCKITQIAKWIAAGAQNN